MSKTHTHTHPLSLFSLSCSPVTQLKLATPSIHSLGGPEKKSLLCPIPQKDPTTLSWSGDASGARNPLLLLILKEPLPPFTSGWLVALSPWSTCVCVCVCVWGEHTFLVPCHTAGWGLRVRTCSRFRADLTACVCVCVCACIHMCVRACVCSCACMRVCVFVFVCLIECWKSICVWVYVCAAAVTWSVVPSATQGTGMRSFPHSTAKEAATGAFCWRVLLLLLLLLLWCGCLSGVMVLASNRYVVADGTTDLVVPLRSNVAPDAEVYLVPFDTGAGGVTVF